MTETIKITKINGTTGTRTQLKDRQTKNREKFIKDYFKNTDYNTFDIEHLDFMNNKRHNLEIYVKQDDQLTIYILVA